RADPLGAMAFCESLEQIPSLTVRRDFLAANRLPEEPHTTYLHLAARPEDWYSLPQDLVQEIESFLSRGGRLAVTFFPETARPFVFFPSPISPPGATNKIVKTARQSGPVKPGKKKSAQTLEEMLHRVSLKTKWGLNFGFLPLPPGDV